MAPAKRYFTAREVERLIPRLETLMGRAMRGHLQVSRLRQELEAAQRRVVLAGGMRLHIEWWRVRKAGIDAASRAVRTGLDEIVRCGGAPKDLETGLVDFPGLVGGEAVNLCWKLGEREVRYWHRVDEGFAARKPLPDEERER